MSFGRQICILVILGAFFFQGFAVAAEKNPAKLTPDKLDYLKSVQARETAVVSKEKALEQREQNLEVIQKEVDEKIAKLTTLQEDLQARLADLQLAKDNRFRNLIKIYSEMGPAKVAPLLNEMDVKTVAQILQAMKSDVVVKIIPKLDKEKALAVSKEIGALEAR